MTGPDPLAAFAAKELRGQHDDEFTMPAVGNGRSATRSGGRAFRSDGTAKTAEHFEPPHRPWVPASGPSQILTER